MPTIQPPLFVAPEAKGNGTGSTAEDAADYILQPSTGQPVQTAGAV